MNRKLKNVNLPTKHASVMSVIRIVEREQKSRVRIKNIIKKLGKILGRKLG